ncbi:hypothetical protein [Clostridium pasteurianum]|uniref:hypothetical protein n=1 Tax=Clostridium pasteurianum TaxID=1501 RepID=UPI00059FD40F|nr:hypothetical protein [Clostridium pasteurianum]
MRTKIPIEMQGRVFSARNTLQYFSIPVGYILGGLLTDKLLEPFMKKPSAPQQFFSYIVGNGTGAGSGLIYIKDLLYRSKSHFIKFISTRLIIVALI